MENIKRTFTLLETNASENGDEPPTKKVKETPVEGDEEGASDPKDVGRPEVLPKAELLSGEAVKLSLGQEEEALPKPEAIEVLKSSSDQQDDSLPKLETSGVEADQAALGAEDDAVPNLESSAPEADQSIFGPQNEAVPNLESSAVEADQTEEEN